MVTVADLKSQGVKTFRHATSNGQWLKDSPDFLYFQMIFTNMLKADFVDEGLTRLEDALGAELLTRFKAVATAQELQRTDAVNKQAATTDFKNYFQVPAQASQLPDRPRGDVNIHKGLLTGVLAASEAQFGFGQLSYAWGTSAQAFLLNLKARRPFKDYGASRHHGDNTHRVQWYILCNLLFNGMADAARLYEGTADWVCDVDGLPGNRKRIYLWELLCDNASNTTGWTKSDAVGLNPVYVMERMCDANDFPLLASFCAYRKAKDLSSEVKSPHFSSNEGDRIKALGAMPKTLHRAAVRYLGRPLANLSGHEKQQLIRYLGGMGFTLQ